MGLRTTLLVAAGLVLAMAGAHAGVRQVRDADGSRWRVVEDPAEGAQGFVLQRLDAAGQLDARFGRGGQVMVSGSAVEYAPTSLRVDAQRRVWMAGTGITGELPLAVVTRYRPDGSLDLTWGAQGRVTLSPAGLTVRPHDLLPLSDGSVLVAGVASNLSWPNAIVFHLGADGRLDTAFGQRGVWQRLAPAESSAATSLGSNDAGQVAALLTVEGAGAELWLLSGPSPTLIRREPMAADADTDALRLGGIGDRWAVQLDTGGTPLLSPASLQAPVAQQPAASAVTGISEGLQTVLNPYGGGAPASYPKVEAVDDDGGIPWAELAAAMLVVGGLAMAWRSWTRRGA